MEELADEKILFVLLALLVLLPFYVAHRMKKESRR